jgi:hypothetical protein
VIPVWESTFLSLSTPELAIPDSRDWGYGERRAGTGQPGQRPDAVGEDVTTDEDELDTVPAPSEAGAAGGKPLRARWSGALILYSGNSADAYMSRRPVRSSTPGRGFLQNNSQRLDGGVELSARF